MKRKVSAAEITKGTELTLQQMQESLERAVAAR